MNPLLSVRGAITAGFIAAAARSLAVGPTAFGELSLARRLHILPGIPRTAVLT